MILHCMQFFLTKLYAQWWDVSAGMCMINKDFCCSYIWNIQKIDKIWKAQTFRRFRFFPSVKICSEFQKSSFVSFPTHQILTLLDCGVTEIWAEMLEMSFWGIFLLVFFQSLYLDTFTWVSNYFTQVSVTQGHSSLFTLFIQVLRYFQCPQQ